MTGRTLNEGWLAVRTEASHDTRLAGAGILARGSRRFTPVRAYDAPQGAREEIRGQVQSERRRHRHLAPIADA
jgi:hypothetical protein